MVTIETPIIVAISNPGIKSSLGTILNWGSGKALKRFIPSRHIMLADMIAREEKKSLFDKELFL